MPRQQKMVTMTPAQCRAGRALLDMTQPDLAQAARLGLSTVVDFERSRRRLSEEARDALQMALEAAGVEFTNGDQPGVRLKKPTEGNIMALIEESPQYKVNYDQSRGLLIWMDKETLPYRHRSSRRTFPDYDSAKRGFSHAPEEWNEWAITGPDNT
jgi:transcriptional regulator with XRE-family HTH domain